MKGVWYIVESVFASIIMIGFLIAINALYFVNPYPSDISSKAYGMLQGLDDRGMLRNFTENLDTASMESAMETYTYNMSMQICDYAGSCAGSQPDASNVWAGTYLVAGYDDYQPREVRLYLWPM